MQPIRALDHIVLTVRDVEISAAWYQRVLGMTREDYPPGEDGAVRTSVIFGPQKINLRPVAASQQQWFTADQPAVGSGDLCFLTSSPPEEVTRHLTDRSVAIEEGLVARRGAQGPITSVYCRDPDGSLIEIASYSADISTKPGS
jgi:catechol 2,3-dioxygenase-like lactoylglutathione lyase family enzyme